jgi:hypothetical protein
VFARSDLSDFTLDVVATFIETEKQCAKMIFRGSRGFAALLSFIAELGLCVACDCREGSVPAGVGIMH